MSRGVCISHTSLFTSAAVRDSSQLSYCGYFLSQKPVFIDILGVERVGVTDQVKFEM